jgi:transcriptional regulator NrdR family protein
MKHIVKRSGSTEMYDERKLYASIYAACLGIREPVGAAELIAERVCSDMQTWLKPKSEVSSSDIRTQAAKHLQQLNEHAAFLYAHHRIMW